MADGERVVLLPGARSRVQAVADRLYSERRMTGDEMRDAAQRLESALALILVVEGVLPPDAPEAAAPFTVPSGYRLQLVAPGGQTVDDLPLGGVEVGSEAARAVLAAWIAREVRAYIQRNLEE
jgi:hypothetical protein